MHLENLFQFEFWMILSFKWLLCQQMFMVFQISFFQKWHRFLHTSREIVPIRITLNNSGSKGCFCLFVCFCMHLHARMYISSYVVMWAATCKWCYSFYFRKIFSDTVPSPHVNKEIYVTCYILILCKIVSPLDLWVTPGPRHLSNFWAPMLELRNWKHLYFAFFDVKTSIIHCEIASWILALTYIPFYLPSMVNFPNFLSKKSLFFCNFAKWKSTKLIAKTSSFVHGHLKVYREWQEGWGRQ